MDSKEKIEDQIDARLLSNRLWTNAGIAGFKIDSTEGVAIGQTQTCKQLVPFIYSWMGWRRQLNETV